jgi:hypothetical protein
MDNLRKLCQRVYWVLHSLRPDAAYNPFEVRRRRVLSLILPHGSFGNIVFTGSDSASQKKLGLAFTVLKNWMIKY